MDENIKNQNEVPTPPQTPTLNTQSDIKALHTYEGDMARALRENNGSLIKVSLAEQKRRDEEARRGEATKEKSKNFMYFFVGIILVAIVVLGARYVNQLIKDRGINKVSIETRNTFFGTEEQIFLSANSLVGKESSAQLLLATIDQKSVQGAMNSIFFKKESAIPGEPAFLSTQEIISRLGLSIPGPLVRTLNEEMIFGSFTQSKGEPNLFIMFYTNDYDQAFAGMLSWEKNLFSDLFIIFGIDLNDENSYLLDKKWDDLLVDNNDTRVLRDNENNPILYYAFLDRSIFIITDDVDTIRESIKRLRTEKLKN